MQWRTSASVCISCSSYRSPSPVPCPWGSWRGGGGGWQVVLWAHVVPAVALGYLPSRGVWEGRGSFGRTEGYYLRGREGAASDKIRQAELGSSALPAVGGGGGGWGV